MDDGEGVNRRAGSGRKTVVDRNSCGMSFEAVPGRSCANMQVDLRLERQLCDDLSLSLKPSSVSLWIDHCSCLLSALSALNVPDDSCLFRRRVIIFSDEKPWTVDPVRNRTNNRYLSLEE